MKRASLITFTLFLFAIIYSSCKDDIYMDWKLQNERWYATLKDSLNNDTLFHKTKSGLYYKVIHQGFQRQPDANSNVLLNIKGTLIDGSSFFPTTNIELEMSNSSYIPAGLQEGLKKMNGGGWYIFYVPSKIGFDTISTDHSRPPYSLLKYDVKLVSSY